MVAWLGRASQRHEMYYHDLEFIGLNPNRVEFGVGSTSVPDGRLVVIDISGT